MSSLGGYLVLAPGVSPLDKILVDWSWYSYTPMNKKELGFYCNAVWPTYILRLQGRMVPNGSLNSCTIMELELYSLQLGKWDEIPNMPRISGHYTIRCLQGLSFSKSHKAREF